MISKPIRWSQSLGRVWLNDLIIGHGYAGHGDGLNNPNLQHVHMIGPIPRGTYGIQHWGDDKKLGPCVAYLTPSPTNEMFNRSDFRIHGDDQNINFTASDGCIVLSRVIREALRASNVSTLEVMG